jgi:hypothetical protein
MAIPIPTRPNVRNCTHIKVTGQRCGSPALRGEFFCYFHTRVIKGVQQRVDMQLHSMALLEDCESIQLSIMHVVDGLLKGTLDATRARLLIQALRIAARNAKNVRFDDVHYRPTEQPMVREVPNYAHQYLIEHPEYGPPLSPCGAGAPAREAAKKVVQAAAQAAPKVEQQNATQENATEEPAAKRQQNAAHGASRRTTPENDPAPQERKNLRNPSADCDEKEYERIKQAEAALPGAMAGNWRDLRTVFEFAGITDQNKEAPS